MYMYVRMYTLMYMYMANFGCYTFFVYLPMSHKVYACCKLLQHWEFFLHPASKPKSEKNNKKKRPTYIH